MSAPDYIAAFFAKPRDMKHYGIRGMKWGIRRTPAQLAAAGKKGGGSSDKGSGTPKKAPANETSSQRYSRLQAEAKAGRSSKLSDEDLRWFNARTDALARINKLNQQKPGWLQDTSKKVLQEVAKETMKQVASAAAKKYIGAPLTAPLNDKK